MIKYQSSNILVSLLCTLFYCCVMCLSWFTYKKYYRAFFFISKHQGLFRLMATIKPFNTMRKWFREVGTSSIYKKRRFVAIIVTKISLVK